MHATGINTAYIHITTYLPQPLLTLLTVVCCVVRLRTGSGWKPFGTTCKRWSSRVSDGTRGLKLTLLDKGILIESFVDVVKRIRMSHDASFKHVNEGRRGVGLTRGYCGMFVGVNGDGIECLAAAE